MTSLSSNGRLPFGLIGVHILIYEKHVSHAYPHSAWPEKAAVSSEHLDVEYCESEK